jgi:hypothetical protein
MLKPVDNRHHDKAASRLATYPRDDGTATAARPCRPHGDAPAAGGTKVPPTVGARIIRTCTGRPARSDAR